MKNYSWCNINFQCYTLVTYYLFPFKWAIFVFACTLLEVLSNVNIMLYNGPFPSSFLFIFIFSTVHSKCIFINFADGWVQTADLCWWMIENKRPLLFLKTIHILFAAIPFLSTCGQGPNYLIVFLIVLGNLKSRYWRRIRSKRNGDIKRGKIEIKREK